MTYQLATALDLAADVVVVGVNNHDQIVGAHLLPETLRQELAGLIDHQALKLALAQVQTVYRSSAPYKIVLVGLGDTAKGTVVAWQKVAKAVGKALVDCPAKNVQWLLTLAATQQTWLRAVVIALASECYQQGHLKQAGAGPCRWPQHIALVGAWSEVAHQGLSEAQAIAQGIQLTKTLADLPGNYCTPRILAERAQAMAQNSQGRLQVEVLDQQQIAALGMGCFLGVSQGSAEPPRLIVFRYTGTVADTAPIVLVGKGVTFDSGGISLKGGGRMDEMKYDMCGAASIFGVMAALVDLQPAVHVCGVIVATENMPSGTALKPGDVLTSMSGLTVEVLNTDAEGRLILADALTYAERFKPKAVIDVATLTGAIIVALGSAASGLMANDDQLSASLVAAGEATGDRLWPLPLWDDYQELIDTPFADVANLGNDEAKSITAACFLQRFATAYPWAHLDIAGTAWTASGKRRMATGRPVAALMEYILTNVVKK
jgi:leucyl aminopeptidase